MYQTLLFLLIIGISSFSFAGPENRGLIPLGEREMFIANTGIAAMGSAGAVFYNPAELGFNEYGKISLNGTALLQYNSQATNFVNTDNTALPFTMEGTLAVPSTFVSSFKAGTATLALSILVPESLELSNKTSWVTPNETLVLSNLISYSELWFGFSYGQKLSNDLAIGATLFVNRYSINLSQNIVIHVPSQSNTVSSAGAYEQASVYSLTPVAGVLWKATPNVNLGFKIQAPFIPLSGSADTMSLNETTLSGVVTSKEENKSGISANYVMPLEIGAGVAYRPLKSWNLLADVKLQFPTDYNSFPQSTLNSHVKTDFALKGSVGTEITLNTSNSLDFGFLYNPSSVSSLSTGLETSKEDYLGVTAGWIFAVGRVHTGVGGFYLWSSGEAIPVGLTTASSTLSTQVFGFLLSTSYLL